MTICPHCGWPRERADGHACAVVPISKDRLKTLEEAEQERDLLREDAARIAPTQSAVTDNRKEPSDG